MAFFWDVCPHFCAKVTWNQVETQLASLIFVGGLFWPFLTTNIWEVNHPNRGPQLLVKPCERFFLMNNMPLASPTFGKRWCWSLPKFPDLNRARNLAAAASRLSNEILMFVFLWCGVDVELWKISLFQSFFFKVNQPSLEHFPPFSSKGGRFLAVAEAVHPSGEWRAKERAHRAGGACHKKGGDWPGD